MSDLADMYNYLRQAYFFAGLFKTQADFFETQAKFSKNSSKISVNSRHFPLNSSESATFFKVIFEVYILPYKTSIFVE